MLHFDLVDEPWIPCLMVDGSNTHLGLRVALARAPDIREIADPSPLITAALHRPLLAVLHRVFGPEGATAWAFLWRREAFDSSVLDEYWSRWKHRFDLFDPEHPFYQNPELDPVYAWPISKLPLSAGKREPLFEHFANDDRHWVSIPEAARELVALQAFAIGGFVSYERELDPKLFKSADSAPLAKGAMALAKGENLFRTLMLNLHWYNRVDEEPFPFEGEDVPAWEREEPTRAEDRRPAGYLDLLTWQSRRVRLLPTSDETNGWVVRQAVVMKGYQFPDWWSPRDGETMVAYKARTDARSGQEAWFPVGFQREKALWRDSLALFQSLKAQRERPKMMSWLADLVHLGVLDHAMTFRLDLAGLCSDQAKVHFWRSERLPLPLTYLEEEKLVEQLGRALSIAEEVGAIVRDAARALATLLMAQSSDEQTGRKPDRKQVDQLADHLATERRYWARLETPFKRLLVDLAADREVDDEGELRYGRQAMPVWAAEVRRAAEGAFGESTRAAGTTARALKAAAVTEEAFRRRVAAKLKEVASGATV
jgi:CRISPR system Cascade subunit CasA